jgi:hypothetical protein
MTPSSSRGNLSSKLMPALRSNSAPKTPVEPDPSTVGMIKIYGDKMLNRENESYKSFRVTLDETCASILPNVLKKYKIEEDWRSYALFIIHKGQGIINFILMIERCLNFDEKPLQYFQQLKDFDADTSFVLKHIKKHTPESRKDVEKSTESLSRSASSAASGVKQPFSVSNSSSSLHKDTSLHAVAIYEYKANREDELDIMIGDRVMLINREMGWCIVEKNGKRGWVPTGCLHVDEDGGGDEAREPKTAQGYVLYDYEKISPNELSIKKGASLVIYKKYEHWLLGGVVGTNKKGWVPVCELSWLIGVELLC